MGIHAFDTEPGHCANYRVVLGDALPALQGFREGWNVASARHRLALGENAEFPAVDHYVMTLHIGGADVRREDWAASKLARKDAISLQRPKSGGRFSSEGEVDYAHFYFKQSLIEEVSEEAGLPSAFSPADFFAVRDANLAREAAGFIRRAGDETDPPGPIEMDSRAYLMMLALLRCYGEASAGLARQVGRADLRRVVEEIEARIDEPIRLSELAGLIGMSPFHFSRVFRQEIGQSPADYLWQRRTERAVELIRNSPLGLSEIAFQTGFSSQSHMTRRVKRLTGVTPKSIRR